MNNGSTKLLILPKFVDRFWKRVDKTASPNGCWLWTGAQYTGGYGRLYLTQKNSVRAHRFSYEIENGPIPKGLCVCHNCPNGDNPRCVNPAHLFLGTHAENMRDMTRKGRNGRVTKPESTPRGEDVYCAKLTEDNVKSIREQYVPGVYGYKRLSARFGVTRQAIICVIRRKTWTHI